MGHEAEAGESSHGTRAAKESACSPPSRTKLHITARPREPPRPETPARAIVHLASETDAIEPK
jgi:hypothetical protein